MRRLVALVVDDLTEVETTYRPVGAPGEYLAGTVYQTVETGIGFVYRAPQQAPGSTRVLMTAAPDVLWGHCLAVPDNAFQELCDQLHSYGRGEHADVQFAAALHPEVVETRHSASSLFVETGLGDGRGLSGLAPAATESSRLTLYKDGELVATRDGTFGFFPLPKQAGRFRLEQEWTLGDVFARSRRARTVWTFDSAPPSDPSQGGSTTPPFLTLDYGADVDGLGRAEPRRPLRLELRAGHVVGADAPERIDALQVQWSIDGGARWQDASTNRTGTATFDATVPGIALQSGGSLSLRAVAADAAGNRVDQTVHGIIPVR